MRHYFLFILFIGVTSSLFSQSFQLDLQPFITGLNQPLDVENVGDARLFVIEKQGTIAIVNSEGIVEAARFLDIESLINADGERGLLGLAFHPNYLENGFFYVNYTDNNGDTVISRFSVNPDNPNDALEDSELELLSYSQPFNNHNGGDITFGPDGMLYIASGDGGSGGDPGDRAQDLNEVLGKILRLDVDIAAPYIPSDNPFASDGNPNTRGEIWAFGLRNPYRIFFDGVNDDFWIADVGQNAFEEVNKVTNNPSGLNYGWRCFEGNSSFDRSGNCPDENNPPDNLTFPIIDYGHTNNRASVTGGHVYRGSEFSTLEGIYIFADFSSGELASIDTNGSLSFFEPTNGSLFTGFGTDQNNVLYATTFTGEILKVVDANSLGLASQMNVSEIKMSPNPAQQFVQIQVPENESYNVTFYNLAGQILNQEPITGNQRLDVSFLSSGIYLVAFTAADGDVTFEKLVINQ